MASEIDNMPYSKLSDTFGVSRKTIWAIANGLTTISKDFLDRLNDYETNKSNSKSTKDTAKSNKRRNKKNTT